MATEVSIACSPGPKVSADVAEGICREFTAALTETYPSHSFGAGDDAPGIILTVTSADERSLGLEVVWISTGGSRTAGMPLSTAFYDRNSDQSRRRQFYATFLQHNPLPF